jgi:hypothetical protein
MYEDVRITIANYLQANWSFATYPLFAENVGETQPADQVYGRYAIRPVNAVSNIVGANNAGGRRVNGLLWFQIFGVEAKGSTDPMKFADMIASLFDEKWLTPAVGILIKFRRAELTYVGIEPSGRPHWKCVVGMVVDDQRLAVAYKAA